MTRRYLLNAAKTGYYMVWSAAWVQFVKNRDTNLNLRDERGNTALYYVTKHFAPRCAFAMMELGANPHSCHFDDNPLRYVAPKLSASTFVKWIHYGIDSYAEWIFDEHHDTTVAALVQEHHARIMARAIRQNSNRGVETVLRHVKYSKEDLFELMLVECAKHEAAECAAVIAREIAYAPNPHDRLNTVLHYAAEYTFMHPVFNNVVAWWPSDRIDTPNCYGETALHFAMTSTKLCYKLCRDLIDRGADPNHCDLDGLSPMLSGTTYMRKCVARNSNGRYLDVVSPMHTNDLDFFHTHAQRIPNVYGTFVVAARHNRKDIMGWFMSRFRAGDFDIHMTSPRGDTPLHVLVRYAPFWIPTALQLGANIHQTNHDGVTPLDLAKERNIAYYF